MSLVSRITLHGPASTDPEDFLSSSLGVIFPDDVTNQHGDAEHSLVYTSPHLPKPLHIALSDPDAESDRKLFSHYLWNSSLLLAELVEAGTLGLEGAAATTTTTNPTGSSAEKEGRPAGARDFNIANLTTLELGAGTALPSILAALLGARSVAVTDYPSPTLLTTLRKNVTTNCFDAALSPRGVLPSPVRVEGHAWGAVDHDADAFAAENRHAFDRVFVCDCLWMPWQHDNLQRSIAHFLKGGSDAVTGTDIGTPISTDTDANPNPNPNATAAASSRAWIVAGFHTGRAKMAGFFEAEALREHGLEVEDIWERDCDGVERPWAADRGIEDVSERKRWLVVGVLRRIGGWDG